ncbi:MAG TPA: AGE family epimerase/isomerase [Cyclobacteriaceae bacterium]|nr:AGE family epimerase/isomerase [Cyclobacteriaceae bacterium]
MAYLKVLLAVFFVLILNSCSKEKDEKEILADSIEHSLTGTLDAWYPRAIDSVHGGFLSSFTFDFRPADDQRKMIVSQSRHVWTNSKAALRYPKVDHYKRGATHGYKFLRDVMWDSTYGGFYWLVERDGTPVKDDTLKTAYGNAFGIYALAAYYEFSKDPEALQLAKDAFMWLELHSHDHEYKGYYQHLHRDGTPVMRARSTPSTAETGYKDQNSSIHLLEAFTELYLVWQDPLLKERLREMLFLIRDTMVTPDGYLTLFMERNWTPVSFRDKPDSVIEKHHSLDHVSYGHDVETAFLMIEASHVLGIKKDSTTHRIARKMVDHSLNTGWDETPEEGSFYDEGYYFKDKPGITITRDTKNWWAQAEGMNCLLMMSELYPNDPAAFYDKFKKSWHYIDVNLIDHQYGDWFAGGLDKQPEMKTAMKGHIWKACYHQYRAMANCVDMIRKGSSISNHDK